MGQFSMTPGMQRKRKEGDLKLIASQEIKAELTIL